MASTETGNGVGLTDKIGFIKHRWYYELYCKGCGRVIGQQHKRRGRGSIARTPDYFKPYLCVCGDDAHLAWTLDDIVEKLGIFKGRGRRATPLKLDSGGTVE